MKLLLLISIFLSTLNSFATIKETISDQEVEAQGFPVCSLFYANSVKKKLLKISNDKYKHCAVSCMLANRCGTIDALEIGIYKELWDLVSPGDADWKDIEADIIGVNMSHNRSAKNDYECNEQCKNIDWNQLPQ